MRVLLTGASSFTGYWFAKTLAGFGHDVIAPLRGRLAGYEGIRHKRLAALQDRVTLVEECAFGDERFLELISSSKVDVLAHHGANVADFRSLDFDVAAALRHNTMNLRRTLQVGKESGLRAAVLTGSVFEQGEGAGSAPLLAFSPYGLSKGMTADAFRFWCDQFRLPLGKFVIPNPFGPFEEQRFCHYLLQCWASGKAASVKTPAYVRDNIHVSLLALAYADFVAGAPSISGFARRNPSGYAESQGAFTTRFAREIGSRLGIEAPIDLQLQTEFAEPAVRVNTDIPDRIGLDWSETMAWDELAEYYRLTYFSK